MNHHSEDAVCYLPLSITSRTFYHMALDFKRKLVSKLN